MKSSSLLRERLRTVRYLANTLAPGSQCEFVEQALVQGPLEFPAAPRPRPCHGIVAKDNFGHLSPSQRANVMVHWNDILDEDGLVAVPWYLPEGATVLSALRRLVEKRTALGERQGAPPDEPEREALRFLLSTVRTTRSPYEEALAFYATELLQSAHWQRLWDNAREPFALSSAQVISELAGAGFIYLGEADRWPVSQVSFSSQRLAETFATEPVQQLLIKDCLSGTAYRVAVFQKTRSSGAFKRKMKWRLDRIAHAKIQTLDATRMFPDEALVGRNDTGLASCISRVFRENHGLVWTFSDLLQAVRRTRKEASGQGPKAQDSDALRAVLLELFLEGRIEMGYDASLA